jgi:hypothetical protein
MGCDTDRTLTGEYIGFYCGNEWRITFKPNQEYDYYSNGHWFGLETKGKYFIKGDTLILDFHDTILNRYSGVDYKYLIEKDSCLIGIEAQYDLCKVRPDLWASNTRDINYPQTKAHRKEDVVTVVSMLQEALNQLDSKYIADTAKNLIVKEYFQIRSDNHIQLTKFSKPVMLLSENEIKTQGVNQYVSLSIRYGQESADISLEVEPGEDHIYAVFIEYRKEKGEWKKFVYKN